MLPIITYERIDEAEAFVKARPKPLALYLFTRSAALEEHFLTHVPFGGGCVNDTVVHLSTPASHRMLPTQTFLQRISMELVDCHTHTVYSDGASTLRENMVAAVQAGLSLIACTDHLAHPAYMDCAIDEASIASYAAEISQLREAFPTLDIIYGFEADWYPGCEADIAAVRAEATFLLGSVHYLDEFAIDWSEDMRAWEMWGANGVWERYVEAWCTACSSSAFDSMAHPDLMRLMGPAGYTPTIPLEPLWNRMAQAARKAGVHVEVSTAALRKNLGDCYPEEGLLRRFCEAGVPITVGSDAHKAAHVGHAIAEACAYAARVGYASIDVPTVQGGWRSVPIV